VDNPANDFSRLKPEKPSGGRLAVGGRDPPPAGGLAGVTVAALNTYKKNFLKNLLH
jgi:hypothetical protein